MSYHIYQTEGFVIESLDKGESNKLLTIFTKDLGLIHASAQGLRTLKSKLRYSLQELSYSTIALVRGKEMWRITNARKLISLYDRRLPLQLRRMIARILAFVKRLMPEEGKNEELFSLLQELSGFCFNERGVFLTPDMQPSLQNIEATELLTKLRILRLLGYGTSQIFLEKLSQSATLTQDVLTELYAKRTDARVEIDKALSESHL